MKNSGELLSSDVAGCNERGITLSRLAAIVESLEDAIIGEDLNGIITDWNKGAEIIFGYAEGEMVGTSVTRVIPAERQQEEDFILEKIKLGEKVEHFETLRQTKEGRLVYVSVTALPIKDSTGKIFGISKIAHNLTSQKHRERELARLTRLYAALSQINQAIIRMPSREGLFERLCEVLVEHGGFCVAWIGWHDPQTHRLKPVAVSGDGDGYVSSIKIYADDRPEGRGPIGLAFRLGRPFVCNDMLNNPITLPWRAELVKRGFKAAAAFPIRLQNAVSGTLAVYSEDASYFQDQEIALLQNAASDVSFALDNLAEKEARRQMEREAESERLFSTTMIESMPGILYFYNEHGRFLRWNRNFEIVSGYSSEEIARMNPLDFFTEREKEPLRQKITEVFAEGESFVEAALLAKDGRTTPYFLTGKRVVFNGNVCLVGMGIDISQQKRVELELREIQGQLEAVIEHLREGLVIADPEGGLLRWNPAALRFLGFTDLAEGRRRQREFAAIFELYTLEGARIPLDQWPLARVRRGDSIDNLEIRVCRIGSNWERILSYAGSPVCYAGDKKLAFMTLRDITDRKRAETALRVLNQTLELEVAARTSDLQAALVRAEAADRIKSAFLATMSHELRTPLNSIIGFTGIILQGMAGPLNAEQSKQLGMVRKSARHLLELINDVLDLSKIEAGQLEVRAEPFNLRDLLEHVSELVEPLAKKKDLTLNLTMPPYLSEMVSDRRRVEQILINLINNAIKFTQQGSITVTVEQLADYQAVPEVGLRPAMRFGVKDSGLGIKPEDLMTLFQPFRQIDTGIARQHEGTGLGLVICRRLATLLGGEISVTSEWLKGSEFTVTIPLQNPRVHETKRHPVN